MKKYVLILAFLLFGFIASQCSAQDFWHRHNGYWHNHPHTTYHYHGNAVAYYPVVQWYPTNGVYMNVGPVYANPYNRRVYMTIGPTFYFVR